MTSNAKAAGAKTTDEPPREQVQPASLAGLKLGTLSPSFLENSARQANLQVLDLKDSKIAHIPAEVYRAFPRVKVLDLRKNILEGLLPEISAMREVEDLLVDQNRLRAIPAEVCSLPNLKSLQLSQNLLKGLPPEVGKMVSLRSLSLGDNQISKIPDEIGSCKELQTLHLHHNHFTQLPTTLGQLENLAEIALEWFRYTTPPLPRVIKGAEWKRIIVKLLGLCEEKRSKGQGQISCIEVLSQFSQKSFDPNAIDSKRRTRLHVACLEGHVGVAMSLAESGSKCDSLDIEGYSPLLVAVREEHPDIATALVRVGADVNTGGGLFGSPLHVATVNFDPQMVLLLIHGKADVNQTDADGNTPLHVLMSVFDKGGKRACAIGQLLLRHGADCNLMNSDKWAPLHLGARRGQLRGICFVISHIESCDSTCLKGSCSHQATHKKAKSSRVSTCTRAFDLNLRGGSHLWTPLHLAGHACHVPVVQVLIEAGADVFLRNVDNRTARQVSRGNLAISKLLRKAEDEWLWYRIHQTPVPGSAENASSAATPAPERGPGRDALPRAVEGSDESLIEALKTDDDEHDAIEEIAKNIEGLEVGTEGFGVNDLVSVQSRGREARDAVAGGPPAPRRRGSSKQSNRIIEQCREVHLSKSEQQQLQDNNFSVPTTNIDEFVTLFTKLTQQGPRHRLPFLLSKSWVKELVPRLLEEEKCHSMLLQPGLVSNEDFIRMLICNVPQDRLFLFGKVRDKEQEETMLHTLCKGNSSRAYPSSASRADILSLLLTVCPPETFNLEARDLRGQTPLHLAAQNGDIALVQVLLEYGADPNAQEETTGWTPLHFAVAKGHYTLVLQFLHHDATNVNQVDKFDWPPLLEACSRLDARSTSLLVNGGANLMFRNQHHFDVLKAVDTSKKDLAAKRWMSCLLVSNGFRFEESMVQLNSDDRETLESERAFYDSRSIPASNPPFFVPDHLAPRCHTCKMQFHVTVRRYTCRSCGLVLCGDCFKWRMSSIVPLDERQIRRQVAGPMPGPRSGYDQGPSPMPVQPGSRGASRGTAVGNEAAGGAQASAVRAAEPSPRTGSEDSFDDPPLAEELPAPGPPMSVVCPGSMMSTDPHLRAGPGVSAVRHDQQFLQAGALLRERGCSITAVQPTQGSSANRNLRLCGPCSTFFEAGVGETYAMLQSGL